MFSFSFHRKDRRFLAIHQMQFILIEPDIKRSGWGIVKFSDLIQVTFFVDHLGRKFSARMCFQDVEVSQDRDDNRSLQIIIHKPVQNIYVKNSPPVLNAKFTFDDHIRCMTAKQNLLKARKKFVRIRRKISMSTVFFRAREMKLEQIGEILQVSMKNCDE